MHPYRYWATIRVWHPKRDLAPAAKAFGLKPKRMWKAGDPRQTPKGSALPGVNQQSYWFAQLTPKRGLSSKQSHVEVFIAKALKRFAQARPFISRTRATGGEVELLVSVYGKKNYALMLPPEILSAAGRLGFRLSIDVYPENQGGL